MALCIHTPVQISSNTLWLQFYCLITVQDGFSVTAISTVVTSSCEEHLILMHKISVTELIQILY